MEWTETASQCCDQSISTPELQEAARAVEAAGVPLARVPHLVAGVTELPESLRPLEELRRAIGAAVPEESIAFEQLLLLLAMRDSLSRVASLPLTEDGVRRVCLAAPFLAAPGRASRPWFRLGHASFASMCKVATLRRFPVGQFEWEVSGIPRSTLLAVAPREIPRVLLLIGGRLRGLAPLMVPHYAVCGGRRLTLPEGEARRSFFRMAQVLRLRPELRGLTGASWFFSPQIDRVAPHLVWLRELITGNGGMVATLGPADAGSGIASGSGSRRGMVDADGAKPRLGLMLWPREALIAWAERHPELASDSLERFSAGSGVPAEALTPRPPAFDSAQAAIPFAERLGPSGAEGSRSAGEGVASEARASRG